MDVGSGWEAGVVRRDDEAMDWPIDRMGLSEFNNREVYAICYPRRKGNTPPGWTGPTRNDCPC